MQLPLYVEAKLCLISVSLFDSVSGILTLINTPSIQITTAGAESTVYRLSAAAHLLLTSRCIAARGCSTCTK